MVLHFDSGFTGFVSGETIVNKAALVQVIAWCQRGSEPEPMLSWRHMASLGHNELTGKAVFLFWPCVLPYKMLLVQ